MIDRWRRGRTHVDAGRKWTGELAHDARVLLDDINLITGGWAQEVEGNPRYAVLTTALKKLERNQPDMLTLEEMHLLHSARRKWKEGTSYGISVLGREVHGCTKGFVREYHEIWKETFEAQQHSQSEAQAILEHMPSPSATPASEPTRRMSKRGPAEKLAMCHAAFTHIQKDGVNAVTPQEASALLRFSFDLLTPSRDLQAVAPAARDFITTYQTQLEKISRSKAGGTARVLASSRFGGASPA